MWTTPDLIEYAEGSGRQPCCLIECPDAMTVLKLNRSKLKELALMRLRDAEVLLKGKRYGGAYYLCGYAVECALKAGIAKKTNRYDFPDKDAVNDNYTHSLTKLIKVAGLQGKLDDECHKDKLFDQNWTIVKDWSEHSRYHKHNQQEVQALYEAVSDINHGVIQWISQNW